MSMQAAKKAKPEAQVVTKPARKWKIVVNDCPDFTPAERLEAAARGAPRAVPYRAELEAAFGTPLNGVDVVQTPATAEALDEEGAQAALVGERILLHSGAPLDVVAHEVAHLMQRREVPIGLPINGFDAAKAEDEAVQAGALAANGRVVSELTQTLPPNTVAFLRDTDAEIVVQSDDEATEDFRNGSHQDRADSTTDEQSDESNATESGATASEQSSPSATIAPQLDEDVAQTPIPTFEPAPMPEIDIDSEASAAASAEADAALQGAENADDLMAAFQRAPPSVKAAHHDALDADANALSASDQAAFDAELPEFPAQMSGTADLPELAPVVTPGSSEPTLEDGSPDPAPEPQVDPTPDAGAANLNAGAEDILARLFTPGNASGLGQAFDGVATSDTDVDTSAGARPDVPLEGESDPERVNSQDCAARADAHTRRDEAANAVIDGPGPEAVQLHELSESYTLEPRELPAAEMPEAPVEGAAAFRDKALDAEVTALFDTHHNDAMAASLDGARVETESAVQTRNVDRDQAVADAETERERLNSQADLDQQAEVIARRQDVQTARQSAVDEQAGHVADLETLADDERRIAEDVVDDQVSTTDTEVTASFDQAETDAQTEVVDGETRADDERDRREREASEKSWWDRASDWVGEQFDKLTTFINDVFDSVRKAVKDIIDKVKAAAIALIDKAVKAIAKAIETLGEKLKGAISSLLEEHFPEVARVLNEAIDGAVGIATRAVTAIGETLKSAVTALLDGLAAGLDAILALYQAALNAVLAIARAALTGDWDALVKLVLEPILLALGIQPVAFYELIGRTQEALGIIIDDPVGFLGNLVDSVTGGIRQFASNLFTHLQAGIIGWLTGALGGIEIPERWDIGGVLDLARQILGLTGDMIRRVAVRVLGESAVEKIEFFMGYAAELIANGWNALWEKITADLGNLKDAVLEQIKSFLFERIVVASITWLASLFSPVGALIKLIMTIWNFVMFLKDQLARLVALVQKVVQTMYEIATGVLAPAIQGIEDVLARFLPVAIDLFARLLGLGNVAGRVQRIIGGIQQKIEDAIVKLITRVLARFRGRRGDDADGPPAGEDGDIMAPLTVRGGDETHTLSIEDRGENVVPMIRSTPMSLSEWLDGRMGTPFTERSREQSWEGDQLSTKRSELQELVTEAKRQEGLLDAEAEEAEDAINEQAAGQGTAADEKAEVGEKAQDTKRAIEKVLEFFGLAGTADLSEVFEDELAALEQATVAAQLTSRVFPRLASGVYAMLTWSEVKNMLPNERELPQAWQHPAASDGIVRRAFGTDYQTAVAAIVGTTLPDSPIVTDTTGEALTAFLNRKLTAELNKPGPVALMLGALLSGAKTAAAALNPVSTIIGDAAKPDGEGLEYDFEFKKVTGTFYRDTLPGEVERYIEGGIFGKYYEDDDENVAGAGSGVNMKMLDFIKTGSTAPVSKRASKNRQRMADAVRGANRGQHEWIASRLVADIITKAADALLDDNIRPLEGAAKVLKFQHEVRTPTEQLIFKPGTAQVDISYQAFAHRQSAEHAGTKMPDLPSELQAAWYPANGPQQDDEVGVLQGHPGAVYARVKSGGYDDSIKPQVKGHHEWDQRLEGVVTSKLSDGTVLLREAEDMGGDIVTHFRNTIWAGSEAPTKAAGRLFQIYFDSRHASKNYADLVDVAKRTEVAITDLESAIEDVFK